MGPRKKLFLSFLVFAALELLTHFYLLKQFNETTLVILTLATSFLFGISFLFYICFTLARPLCNLIKDLQLVNLNDISVGRVKEVLTKNSELKILQGAINNMLKRIEKDYQLIMHKGKFEALGVMAGGLAHEINNPLAIIFGNSNVLKRNAGEGDLESEKVLEKLGKMHDAALRISAIIKQVKQLTEQGPSVDKLKKVQLKMILGDLFTIYGQMVAVEGIEMSVSEYEKELMVLCLPQQILQILMNLVGNSLHALKNECQDSSEKKWIKFVIESSESKVVIKVVDSGKGIKGDCKKLMDPFYTTKEVGQGTGLGLAISKRIAEVHGGELCYLKEEKNTTFALTLLRAP